MENTGSTAYSDFSREVLLNSFNALGGAGANTAIEADLNPLSDRGGLDSDEVLEIVHMQVQVTVKEDRDDGAPSTTPGTVDFRGAFGANLKIEDAPGGATGDLAPDGAPNQVKLISGSETFGNGSAAINATSENGIFSQWGVAASVGFINSAGSSGGSGAPANMIVDEINFREQFGRGPVLDTTDDLSLAVAIIKNGAPNPIECAVRVHLTYDIATVDGVRSRFSLPQQVE